jgi:hypothetical protein
MSFPSCEEAAEATVLCLSFIEKVVQMIVHESLNLHCALGSTGE